MRAAIGVRELRQNASVYLARVARGETIEITDRGHPVAMLTPIAHGEPIVARLKREGRLIPAGGALLDVRPAGKTRRGSVSRRLQRDRSERRL